MPAINNAQKKGVEPIFRYSVRPHLFFLVDQGAANCDGFDLC